MATPLATLLTGLRSDATMRASFEHEPADFMRDHGWDELDPADMAEAMMVLADATPPSESAVWADGAGTFDGLDGADATAGGLADALTTFGDDIDGLDVALEELQTPAEPEPEPDTQSDLEPETETEPGSDAEPEPETQSEAESESLPDEPDAEFGDLTPQRIADGHVHDDPETLEGSPAAATSTPATEASDDLTSVFGGFGSGVEAAPAPVDVQHGEGEGDSDEDPIAEHEPADADETTAGPDDEIETQGDGYEPDEYQVDDYQDDVADNFTDGVTTQQQTPPADEAGPDGTWDEMI